MRTSKRGPAPCAPQLSDDYNPLKALPWLNEAMKLDAKNPERLLADRIRLQTQLDLCRTSSACGFSREMCACRAAFAGFPLSATHFSSRGQMGQSIFGGSRRTALQLRLWCTPPPYLPPIAPTENDWQRVAKMASASGKSNPANF